MQGRRVEFRSSWAEGDGPKAGDYWKEDDGKWGGIVPTGDFCNLGSHEIVEHEDGTITVKPSILVSGPEMKQLWHGFLKKGVWVLE